MSAINQSLKKLGRLLSVEEALTEQLKNTRAAKQLTNHRNELLQHIREIGRSGDLSLIVAIERAIVEGDLERYANSPEMTNSLKTALEEITSIERHIAIVDDQSKYQTINEGHSFPKNRIPKSKEGLPHDQARQALRSHYARLNNMGKSRLDDDEKKILDARKTAIFTAEKLYAERQTKTLGLELTKGKKRGRSL